MKSMKKTFLTTVVAGTLVAAMTMSAAAFTETRGTVSGTGVSIRAEASSQSERVSSVTNGNRLDVIDETTDANGTKWYKVRVDANRTGFIRSDLITLENASASNAATTATTAAEAATTAATDASTTATTDAQTSSGGTQTGTVISDRINVRKEASASSEAIGALARDARIYVTGSVTGSDGSRWYQVKYSTGGVEKVGFVRSDLLRVSDSASSTATTAATAATTAATSATTSVTTTSGNSTASTVKELTPQAGTITGSTVNVRSAAGTANDSVGALTRNTQVTITGETTGSDNAKWYRVNFTSGGSEKTGFVRADLMRVGTPAAEPASNAATTAVTSTTPAPAATPAPAETPAPTEQPAPEEVTPAPAEGAEGTEGGETTEAPAGENASNMGDEYSLVRTAGSDGVEAWYLYDNVNKNRAKVEDLMNAARSIGTLTDLEQSNKTLKTALIILGILLVLLLAAVIFLFIKMRNLLYYEDEGEDEVVVPRRREKVTPQPERERAPKRRRPAEDEDDGMDRIRKREEKRRPAQAREEALRAERPHRKSPEAGAAPASAVTDKAAAETVAEEAAKRPRKPKNFVRDEDFEFEFLDLDDDGRK